MSCYHASNINPKATRTRYGKVLEPREGLHTRTCFSSHGVRFRRVDSRRLDRSFLFPALIDRACGMIPIGVDLEKDPTYMRRLKQQAAYDSKPFFPGDWNGSY